jgi:glycosyltransferase involved in cell wall biosynthesis
VNVNRVEVLPIKNQSNEKITILLSQNYGGGAETAMRELHDRLRAKDYNVEIWGINEDKEIQIESEFSFGRNKFGGFFHTFNVIRKFRSKCKSEKVQTIILNCDLPELFGIFSPWKTRLIIVEQSIYPWMGRRKFGRLVRLLLTLRESLWVRIFDSQPVWAQGSRTIVLGPNLISGVIPSSEKRNRASNIKRIVFIGRFHYQKNPELLIQLANEAQLPLLMVGDGDLKDKLIQAASKSSQSVEFTGFVSNPWALLRDGDILALTSRFEGKPLVIEEALARGVPVISTKLDGLESEYRGFPVFFADNYQELLSTLRSIEFRLEEWGRDWSFPELILRENDQKLELWERILKEVAGPQ